MARSLAALKPGAVNVGKNDLAAGVAFVKEVGKSTGLPWVSSNIRLPDGSAPFPTFKKLKWGELTTVVVAATPANPRVDGKMGIKVLEPVAALHAALAEAGAADLVIALCDLGYNEEHALARELAQLDIIVGGGSGNKVLKDPVRIGKTILLRSADRGRQLGVFDFSFSNPFKWGTPTTFAEASTGSSGLELFGKQLAQKRSTNPGVDDEVLKTIEALSKKAAKKHTPPDGVRYTNTVIFLKNSIAGDPTVQKEISDFKASAKAATLRRPKTVAKPRKPAQKKAAVPSPTAKPAATVPKSAPKSVAKPQPAKQAKVAAPAKTPAKTTATPVPKKTSWSLGTMACRSCHQPQYNKWLVTPHSRSGSVLPMDKVADPNCRACHTSKLTLEMGTSSEGFIGCESCHGEGAGHPEKITKKGKLAGTAGVPNIRRKVAQETCLGCHRGEHNEIFVLEQDYQKVRCDR